MARHMACYVGSSLLEPSTDIPSRRAVLVPPSPSTSHHTRILSRRGTSDPVSWLIPVYRFLHRRRAQLIDLLDSKHLLPVLRLR
jgi:hypothetical protein